MFEFYRIVTRKFCTQLHRCFVEWNWAKDGMKKSFRLNIFNLIYRSQLYKLSETCFQFQFFYFSEMSSPQALREALCTKIFLQCEIERKKPALCLLVWISQMNLWKKRVLAKCRNFKTEFGLWSLVEKVQYILKSSFCYDLQIILKFWR